MADNITLNAGSGGATARTDDIGGIHYPTSKIIIGADGVDDGMVSSANPLPVSAASLPLPAGASTAANQTTMISHVDGIEALLTTIDTDTGILAAKTADYDTDPGTDTVAMLGIALPAAGGAVAGGTGTNPLRTDPTGTTTQPVSGTVTANAGSGTFTVSATSLDIRALASGTDAVDAVQSGAWSVSVSSLPDEGQQLMASSISVAIASDQSAVPVSDDGGSLTVDGTVAATQSGSWSVDIGSLPDEGQQLMAASISVAIASDQSGVPVTDNGGSLTVDGTVTANAGTGTFTVAATNLDIRDLTSASDSVAAVGDVAHDGADSGNPLKLGAKAIAHGSNPTAVAANDRTNLYANRHGIPWSIGGHPNVISRTVHVTDTDGAQTDASIAGAIGTGTKIVVTRLSVLADNANTADVRVKVGFGTTTLPADSSSGADGIIADQPGVPAGGGFTLGDGSGVLAVGGDGAELRLTCEDPAGGAITVSFSYYTIES